MSPDQDSPTGPSQRRDVDGDSSEAARLHDELASYYESRDVRARIAEYCGGQPHAPGDWGARIAGYGGRLTLQEADGAPISVPNAQWEALLHAGADICRSLADDRGTLVQLDIDYTSPQDPGEIYGDPEACFATLEPVHSAVQEAFGAYGIHPLVLMTGRGYHFTARIPLGSALHRVLVEMGSLRESLRRRYESEGLGGRDAVALGRAYEAAGRLLEHLAHGVMKRLHGRTAVPLTLADVTPPGGGSFICLDLTAYADPLFRRYSRCAFSSNQKAWMKRIPAVRPFFVGLPRRGHSLRTLLRARADPAEAAALATRTSAAIPDALGGMGWVDEYRSSPLAEFHRAFERGPQIEPGLWPWSYDSLQLEDLPACVAVPLEFPNPSLLRPVYLRTVALVLWAMGWHPRSISGLVRSRYERDHEWGTLWRRYDAATRADYYVRLFCGAVADGVDDPRTFHCEDQALRGVCDPSRCREDLRLLFGRCAGALEKKRRSS